MKLAISSCLAKGLIGLENGVQQTRKACIKILAAQTKKQVGPFAACARNPGLAQRSQVVERVDLAIP